MNLCTSAPAMLHPSVANAKQAPNLRGPVREHRNVEEGYRKLAWMLVSAFTAIVHVSDVPEQAPPHPVHVDPGSGVAVNVRLVPCANFDEQLLPLRNPQPIPAGLLTTVPFPFRPTDTLYSGLKIAVAVPDESSVTEQVRPVPWQAPSQPTNA